MTAPAALAGTAAGAGAASASVAVVGGALSTAATTFYRGLSSLSDGTADRAATIWGGLDPSALVKSWATHKIGEQLFIAVSTAQLTAASAGEPYVAASLAAQAVQADPVGALVPKSLAGVASDGRDLDDLLFQPVLTSLHALGEGLPQSEALAAGESALRMIVGTQVTDAGRAGAQAAMTADRRATGYVRMLVLPSCNRCAILAGRTYRWSEGFERHPLCDCVHVPAAADTTAADALRTDPQAYFDSLSPEDQDLYFTKSGAQAIRDGADISRVVNASRKSRGLTVPGQRKGGRVMPDELYERANGSRNEAVRLLAEYGYIT